MAYFIFTIIVATFVVLSVVNDHVIEKKGGETQYIWEKGALND